MALHKTLAAAATAITVTASFANAGSLGPQGTTDPEIIHPEATATFDANTCNTSEGFLKPRIPASYITNPEDFSKVDRIEDAKGKQIEQIPPGYFQGVPVVVFEGQPVSTGIHKREFVGLAGVNGEIKTAQNGTAPNLGEIFFICEKPHPQDGGSDDNEQTNPPAGTPAQDDRGDFTTDPGQNAGGSDAGSEAGGGSDATGHIDDGPSAP